MFIFWVSSKNVKYNIANECSEWKSTFKTYDKWKTIINNDEQFE